MTDLCPATQGIWTDGSSLIAAGLDQNLNSWLIQQVKTAAQAPGASQHVQESALTADPGTTDQSASSLPHGSQGRPAAATGGAFVETLAKKHEKGGPAANTCSFSLSRIAKQRLQVLEPSSLAILSTNQSSAASVAMIAVVAGRGTQVLSRN